MVTLWTRIVPIGYLTPPENSGPRPDAWDQWWLISHACETIAAPLGTVLDTVVPNAAEPDGTFDSRSTWSGAGLRHALNAEERGP
jgi:hypothetical protein